MPDSERVTWEECPHCREAAAVGWWRGFPVEFDCPQGCRVRPDQLDALGSMAGMTGDQTAL